MTDESDTRVAHVFYDAHNHGALLDRGASFFAEAARDRRLYELIRADDEKLLGLAAAKYSATDEVEITGLLLHPGLRGLGIGTCLLRVMIAHQSILEAPQDNRSIRFIAHVVEGNEAPHGPLSRAGFSFEENVRIAVSEFEGEADHMSDGAYVHGRRFALTLDSDSLDELIYDLWRFASDGGMLADEHQSKIGSSTFQMELTSFGSGAATR